MNGRLIFGGAWMASLMVFGAIFLAAMGSDFITIVLTMCITLIAGLIGLWAAHRVLASRGGGRR